MKSFTAFDEGKNRHFCDPKKILTSSSKNLIFASRFLFSRNNFSLFYTQCNEWFFKRKTLNLWMLFQWKSFFEHISTILKEDNATRIYCLKNAPCFYFREGKSGKLPKTFLQLFPISSVDACERKFSRACFSTKFFSFDNWNEKVLRSFIERKFKVVTIQQFISRLV